jgi:hypothetical protein
MIVTAISLVLLGLVLLLFVPPFGFIVSAVGLLLFVLALVAGARAAHKTHEATTDRS